MLLTFVTILIVYSIKKVQETYWCSSSIACLEKRTDWILRIFTFNFNSSVFFWGSNWPRSNPISQKSLWHMPKVKNSEFKLIKCQVFPNSLLFFIYFLDNISHKFWYQSPPPIINVAWKYLRQFLGTSFGVATFLMLCNIE